MNVAEERKKKYKKKYNYLKRNIKSLIMENAALCDEVAKTQESITIVKEERKFLLRKLLDYESSADGHMNGSKSRKRKSPENNGKNIS